MRIYHEQPIQNLSNAKVFTAMEFDFDFSPMQKLGDPAAGLHLRLRTAAAAATEGSATSPAPRDPAEEWKAARRAPPPTDTCLTRL